MKKSFLLWVFALLIIISAGCSSEEGNNLPEVFPFVSLDESPEGWLKGPNGFFTLEIVREMPIVNAEALLKAVIVTSSDDMTSSDENWLFHQGREIVFQPTDIPIEDRKIGRTFEAEIKDYYRISDPYEQIYIFCRIKMSHWGQAPLYLSLE